MILNLMNPFSFLGCELLRGIDAKQFVGRSTSDVNKALSYMVDAQKISTLCRL